MASTYSTSAGPPASRARAASDRSTSSMRAAETPRSSRLRKRSCSASTRSSRAACFDGHARRIAGAERALLENRFSEQSAGEQNDSLLVREGRSPDELRDGVDPIGLREQAECLLSAFGPVPVAVQRVPPGKGIRVPARGVPPAHSRVVAGVGEIAVERPDRAHEAARVCRDGLGHISAGRRHCAQDAHRRLRARERADASGTLVEGSERRRQSWRIPLLSRKLARAGGDLAERFRPA